MDVRRSIREAHGLTPAEQQLAEVVLGMGERLQGTTIKELARTASVSIATVHRLCRKLELEGFKELKVELARAEAASRPDAVDINFPFQAGEQPGRVATNLASLYRATLRDTLEVLDAGELGRAAELVAGGRVTDIYTQSHNLHPARMFRDRLLSSGRSATCEEDIEGQIRRALASGECHVAVAISYSGRNPNFRTLFSLLAERGVPVVLVGSHYARELHPGLGAYLIVSDLESQQDRITQFASHMAVQFALDALYGCVFARSYEQSLEFLELALPYTRLPDAP